MNKLNLNFIFTFLILFPILSFSETLTRMRLDSVRFQERDGTVRYEFPISIFRGRLYYQTNEKGIRYTSYRIRTRIYRDQVYLGEEVWDRVHYPSEGSTAKGFLPDLASVAAPDGIYRIEIELTDSAGHFRDRAIYENVNFQTDTVNFSLSGLFLSCRIESSTTDSEFHKNGFLVLPYAEKVFGNEHPLVYLYWEQYHQLPDTVCSYQIQLFDQNQKLIHSSPKKVQKLQGNRGFHLEVLPVFLFPTGTYTVQVQSTIYPSNRTAVRSSKIYLYTDSVAVPSLSKPISVPSTRYYPPIEQLYYLIDKDVRDQLLQLSEEEQLKWSENFWKEQESKAHSPRNVRLDDYLKRLAFVKQFDTWRKEGWQTDRGRVYLMYGPPDEINDYAFQSSITSEISSEFTGGNKPYVIWKYHTLGGGTEFIFGDIHLFGDFELLHSTMPGEKYDPFWWKKLKGVQ